MRGPGLGQNTSAIIQIRESQHRVDASRVFPPSYNIRKNTQKTHAMSQQRRQSKRPYSAIDSENDSPTMSSQRARRPTEKLQQSMLGFGRRPPTPRAPASQSLLSNVTSIQSSSPEQSTHAPSLDERPRSTSPTVAKRRRLREEIFASRRTEFEVNLALLDGEYKHRLRGKRAVANARISWIYLHGRELEKRKGTKWNKYWLCKHCYERGIMKPLRADSTYSCSRHLESAHNIMPLGVIAPTSQLDSYLEEVHPLAAER